MKSTRLRLDPQGYIAGDAGVTQRVCAQAFSAVLGQVVSMRDRERARDGSVKILSLRTLRVFSDHKEETDSSAKGLVSLTLNVGQRQVMSPSLSPALHPLFFFSLYSRMHSVRTVGARSHFLLSLTSPVQSKGGQNNTSIFETELGFCAECLILAMQCTLHVASAVDL